jgi:hypothetical protein
MGDPPLQYNPCITTKGGHHMQVTGNQQLELIDLDSRW